MDKRLVVATDISRQYNDGSLASPALQETSCTVRTGDRIALVGPSGSGKSTLLHLLGGLDLPTTGTVSWPALGPRAELRPLKIIDIFQGPSLLLPLTVLENVRLPLLLGGVDDREATERASAALARFNVLDLQEKLPEELSGGQAQRIAIARAVAVEPALILADEPTGQLDAHTAQAVLDELFASLDEAGTAMLMATHDPNVAGRFETVWRLVDGHLLMRQDATLCTS